MSKEDRSLKDIVNKHYKKFETNAGKEIIERRIMLALEGTALEAFQDGMATALYTLMENLKKIKREKDKTKKQEMFSKIIEETIDELQTKGDKDN